MWHQHGGHMEEKRKTVGSIESDKAQLKLDQSTLQ
jgi:hypothetical protein